MVVGTASGTLSTAVMSAHGVLSTWRSAEIFSPRSSGDRPMRTNGFETSAGTCQVTAKVVFGSAPNATCRAKGATNEPAARSADASSEAEDEEADEDDAVAAEADPAPASTV